MPYSSTKDLPPQVQKLPAGAKKIFMGAFNSAFEEYGEERAFQISWAAVKQKYQKNASGEWVAKDRAQWPTKDRASTVQIDEVLVLDAASVSLTKDGYMLATPRIARTGIQLYAGVEMGLSDTKVVRVYRPDAEVFSLDALMSLAHKPVTLDHPPKMVNSKNWKRYAVGQLGGEVARDGDFIRIPMMITDQEAIDAIRSGKAELSAGYSADIDWVAGETASGEKYDAVQKSIRINHVAVVDTARGGSMLKIGDDRHHGPDERRKLMQVLDVNGIRLELEDKDASIIQAHIKSLNDQIAALAASAKEAKDAADKQVAALTAQVTELTGQVKTKDAEVVTLTKKLDDAKVTPQMIHDAARQLAEVIGKAHAILGDKLVVDGKTVEEIMRQVVDAELGDLAKGWNDDQVKTSYATIAARAKTTVTADAVALSFAKPGSSSGGNPPAANQAYMDMVNRQRDAWKGKQSA